MRLISALLLLAIFNFAPASAEEIKPASPPPVFAPLPTSAFARLPFVADVDLSPDGTHMAGLFAVGGVQRIVMSPVVGDRDKSVVIGTPDQTEVAWIR